MKIERLSIIDRQFLLFISLFTNNTTDGTILDDLIENHLHAKI